MITVSKLYIYWYNNNIIIITLFFLSSSYIRTIFPISIYIPIMRKVNDGNGWMETSKYDQNNGTINICA